MWKSEDIMEIFAVYHLIDSRSHPVLSFDMRAKRAVKAFASISDDMLTATRITLECVSSDGLLVTSDNSAEFNQFELTKIRGCCMIYNNFIDWVGICSHEAGFGETQLLSARRSLHR